MSLLTNRSRAIPWPTLLVIGATLALAGLMGLRPSLRLLALVGLGVGVALLLVRPQLGLIGLIVIALVAPIQFGTGTDVAVNPTTLFVPALIGIWLLSMIVRRDLFFVYSRVSLPLILFLISSMLSLIIGQATWDPFVPKSNSFILVQIAQWAIFAFSAGAFWMAANLITDETWLRRILFTFIGLAAIIGIVRSIPAAYPFVIKAFTFAVFRPPFWLLLASMAGGQLLFNQQLSTPIRVVLGAIVLMTVIFVFTIERATLSYWSGVAVALAVLIWLKLQRGRLVLIALIGLLLLTGQLLPRAYDFAGGESEWVESGGSRITLAERVISVTMRNPITGLGPAAYRPYARMKPLPYKDAFWVAPNVSSHNNYVDLFAHSGILGLGLFLWFIIEFIFLCRRVRWKRLSGLSLGYVNGVLAAFVGGLVIMMLADWILPFVYNISFIGFQASVLVWLMMGGVVAIDQWAEAQDSLELEKAVA